MPEIVVDFLTNGFVVPEPGACGVLGMSEDVGVAVGIGGHHVYFTPKYTTAEDNDAFVEMFDEFVTALLGSEAT
jgi:hypothetical protein